MEISISKNTAQNIRGFSTDIVKKILASSNSIWDFLTISIAHPFIYSGKGLTISIEPGNMSIAYGQGFLGKIRLKHFRSIKSETNEIPKPAEVISLILSFIKEHNIGIKEIDICIPKSLVITRLIKLPISAKENIDDVIRYELDRLTPFSSDEAFFDFKIINTDEGKITIEIATVKRSSLNPYIEAFKNAGFNVRSVRISINCLGEVVRLKDNVKDFILLNIKPKSCEIGVFQDSRLITSNHIPIDNLDEDRTFETINQLIQRTEMPNKSSKVTTYIFYNHHTEKLIENIKNKVTPYIKAIDERKENLLAFPYQLKGSQTAVAGLIETLWHKSDGFNLLTSGKKIRSYKPVLSTILLFLCLLAIICAYFFAPVHIEKKKISYLESLINQRKPELKRAEALQKEKDTLINEITDIEDFKHSKTMTIDIMKEMTNVLPKNAWLTRFRIADKKIEIEGYASSASELLAKLEASKYFEKVEFSSPTYRDQMMKMDRFQIKMDLEKQ
ncbi:MAG: PilN domain-containing protein [Thermodesulfovibrionales bacterium]|nr:PilN domain-containing protein [Thermodesulfovibrionales bacterium]